MDLNTENKRLLESSKFGTFALIGGLIGLVLTALGYFVVSPGQMYHSWLTAFFFWVTIGLGGLFFTMLHHLTGAVWSIVLRKFSESLMAVLPWMLLFFIPVIFGIHDLYHWSHEEAVAHDHLLQGKAGFLNQPFFIIRAVGYFVIWMILSLSLFKLSVKQDQQHDAKITAKFKKISAPGILLFALSLTFASFDWLMSLDPHWYSTIFGVYIFAGTVLAVLSTIMLVALFLRKSGFLVEVITIEHYQDIAKLLFAFTVFWAYIAFSQYFLIWYGNIPEETVWFLHRWEGSWKTISMIIVFFHFALPFVILITRTAKRNLTLLWVMGFWFLIIHWIDLYWLVLPTFHKHGAHFSWIDLTAMLGIGGIFMAIFWKKFTGNKLIPMNDPELSHSLHFTNV
ncbi:MAG: hypothetical protein H6696_04175 [Deferribacteres bacterium]|nr:hypothetical protein [candidate division KSB1 bacterium]MCB9501111.1 hypothetical protein [Deferribacteres bacterium]